VYVGQQDSAKNFAMTGVTEGDDNKKKTKKKRKKITQKPSGQNKAPSRPKQQHGNYIKEEPIDDLGKKRGKEGVTGFNWYDLLKEAGEENQG